MERRQRDRDYPVAATTDGLLVNLGYQQITNLSSAVGLTVPAGARVAIINAEAQAVRYRDDGIDPTASVGMPIAAGTNHRYSGQLEKIKFIEQTASAKLNVSYYG